MRTAPPNRSSRIAHCAATTARLITVALGACSLSCASPRSDPGTPSHRIAIDSESLQETRQAWIHLPSGYDKSDQAYPVLYVLDAEWVFDFAAGSVDFLSGEIAGRMPEMIVVGIPNTNRLRDLTVSFDTTAAYVDFMRFIETELIPRIDHAYRTNAHRVLYGWSSGSNICLWMMWTKPYLFHGFIASGTGISPRGAAFAQEHFLEHAYDRRGFFANCEGDVPWRREALQRLSTLLERAAPDGLRWKCTVLEEDDHTAVLSKGLLAGLEFLYAECRLPNEVAARGRASIQQYYRDLSQAYGFDIGISVGVANDAAQQLLQEENVQAAIEVLEVALEARPQTAGLYASLGEVYEGAGMLEPAVNSFASAVKVARQTDNRSLPSYLSDLQRLQKQLQESPPAVPPGS